MIRCKACGYIMREGKLKDRCPACGAPKTSFEPYRDLVAPNRRRILGLHLHPIAVHFPTSFAVAALVFLAVISFLPAGAQTILLSTIMVITLFIPLLVLVSILVGWLDGKIRFRKIANSQILQKKILYGILLFADSVALAIIVWVGGLSAFLLVLAAIVTGGIAVLLTILLGLLGMSISNAAFPGK